MSFDDLVGHKPDPEPELSTASVFPDLIGKLGKLGNGLLAALIGTLLQEGYSPKVIGDFSQRMAEDIERATGRRIIV